MRPLGEVSAVFLKLGFTAFGGPSAHIALMRRECVERRGWLGEDRFLDLLAATHLIPGPNSTEMAIHLGYLRAGWPGLFAAGLCFILPATGIMLVLAWAYSQTGSLPYTAGLLYGMKPVVLALIVQALWSLGGSGLKHARAKWIFVAALTAYFFGMDEVVILAAAGIAGWAAGAMKGGSGTNGIAESLRSLTVPASAAGAVAAIPAVAASSMVSTGTTLTNAMAELPSAASALSAPAAISGPLSATAATAAATTAALPLGVLFLKFLKIGSLLFGSGYVLLPFVRAAFSGPEGPLTEAQILDAIALGQVTPGPFFTTATFIGFLVAGVPGGLLATAGIFLPAFFFVAVSGPFLPRLRSSPAAGRILDGVIAASLALMGGAAWQMGKSAIHDWTAAGLLLAALVLLYRKVSPTLLIAAGAATGLAIGWMA